MSIPRQRPLNAVSGCRIESGSRAHNARDKGRAIAGSPRRARKVALSQYVGGYLMSPYEFRDAKVQLHRGINDARHEVCETCHTRFICGVESASHP